MLRVGVIGENAGAVVDRLTALGADIVVGASPDLQFVIQAGGSDRRPEADVVVHDETTSVDDLWNQRLLPFDQNLRQGRRAPRNRVPVPVEADHRWGDDAARLIARLTRAVGAIALRVDHIGSTSIPPMRAKNLIDIQVVVRDLDDARAGAQAALTAGFVPVEGQWFGEDRIGVPHREEVAVDADPGRPTNVNFRPVTAPVWEQALLFRDWLRANADERMAYESMKLALASRDAMHVDRYSEDKMPWIRDGLTRAAHWAEATGWTP